MSRSISLSLYSSNNCSNESFKLNKKLYINLFRRKMFIILYFVAQGITWLYSKRLFVTIHCQKSHWIINELRKRSKSEYIIIKMLQISAQLSIAHRARLLFYLNLTVEAFALLHLHQLFNQMMTDWTRQKLQPMYKLLYTFYKP